MVCKKFGSLLLFFLPARWRNLEIFPSLMICDSTQTYCNIDFLLYHLLYCILCFLYDFSRGTLIAAPSHGLFLCNKDAATWALLCRSMSNVYALFCRLPYARDMTTLLILNRSHFLNKTYWGSFIVIGWSFVCVFAVWNFQIWSKKFI